MRDAGVPDSAVQSRRYLFRQAAATQFSPKSPKRLLKRETWPPRSTSRWAPPVQTGWDSGSMSRVSVSPALPHVDRVVKVLPSVRTTVIS